jgi:hypothetical protein
VYKLALLIIIIVLGGCAAIDNSTQETAETLKPGSIRAGSYMSSAMDAHGILQLYKKYDIASNDNKDKGKATAVLGSRISLGLSKNLEVIGKIGGITTAKLSLKYRFPGEDSTLIVSIMPTISAFEGEYQYDDWIFGKAIDPSHETFSSRGYELPILITKKTGKSLSQTLIVRPAFYPVNYNFISENYDDVNYTQDHKGSADIFVLGLAYNVQMASRFFYLTPTFGVDFVGVPDGYQGIVPNLSLGVGFQINPQGLFK